MIDRLQRFPSQLIENRPQECVGETIADIVGDIANQPMMAGFAYAGALRVSNTPPTTAGSDPNSGMLSAVVYGSVPTAKEPFDATTTSELYEANWANYRTVLPLAVDAQNGVTTLSSYQGVCNYLDQQKQGVALLLTWYSSFMTPLQGGTLPPQNGATTNHCVAVYGHDERGLQIKPWLGPDFGDHGYVYLPEMMFPQVFQGAWGFSPAASRWWSLATIGLTHWNLAADILPLLKS